MDIQMSINDFIALLGRLSVAHTVEQVNNNIMHIKMWHNSKIFRARFVDGVFTNFF